MRSSIDPDVSVLECRFTSLGTWCPAFREDIKVSSSKVEELFLDIPTLEDETKPLSPNFWQQLPSDATPHSRKAETTATLLQTPKNAHKLILCAVGQA
jgi:hypothetical protein